MIYREHPMSTSDTDPARDSTAADAAATGATDAAASSTKDDHFAPSNTQSTSESTTDKGKASAGASAGLSECRTVSVSESSTASCSPSKFGTAAASNTDSDVTKNNNINTSMTNNGKVDTNDNKEGVNTNKVETFSINNPSNSDDLNPLVRISLDTTIVSGPDGERLIVGGKPWEVNEEAAWKSAFSAGYAVNLISGAELCLNKKCLLSANLKFLQKLLADKQEHLEDREGELAGFRASVEEAEANLLDAREELQARETELEHCEAEMAGAMQERADLRKKIEAVRAAAGRPAAPNTAAEEIIENASGDCGKARKGKQRAFENREVGTGSTPSGDEKLARKRSREDNKVISANENIPANDEPPKKSQKFDDLVGMSLMTSGNAKDSTVGRHDADVKPKTDANEAHGSDFDVGDGHCHSEPLVISASVLRSNIRECLNEHRKTEGLAPVPLDEMVFCVVRETGTSLLDEEYIPETLLTSSDITIGVRYFPSLTFEKLIRPFQVLARSIVGEVSENIDGDDGENSDQDSGKNGEGGSNDYVPRSDQKWWDLTDGIEQSEESATFWLASKLLRTKRENDDWHHDFHQDQIHQHRFALLLTAFFRQHLPEEDHSPKTHDSDSLYRVRGDFGCSFPSAKAWVIAAFQLGDPDDETVGLSSWLSSFPKWTAQMVVGLLLHSRPRRLGFAHHDDLKSSFHESVISILRILAKYSRAIPDLTRTVWCWPAPRNLEYSRTLKSPLTCMGDLNVIDCHRSYRRSWSFFQAWSEILLDVFKISHDLATGPSASDAEKEAHWSLKLSICCWEPGSNDQWHAWISTMVKEHADADAETKAINFASPEWQHRPIRKAKLALFRGIEEIELQAKRLCRLAKIAEEQGKLEDERKKLEVEVAAAQVARA